jgi:putative tryptophan/tyrosine transport system ATP-binding protein
MSDDEALLVIRDVTVRYQRWGVVVTALDKISLSVAKGEWLVVTGHNGAGKSSLLNVISSRIVPQTGFATVAGLPVREMSAAQLAESVFHVHQDPLLGTAPALTIYENIIAADREATDHRSSRDVLVKKYSALLEPLGLAGRLKQPVRVLSGGERQLLALFIAQRRAAPIILLDEPLGALDEGKARLCLREIAALQKHGKTLVYVAHHSQPLAHLANRSIVLEHGRIVEERFYRALTRHLAPETT